jgi:RimJ/RimL family protein N-acetyltransferase
MIGDCAFCLLREDSRQAEVGFSLIQAYQGQGYATEAVERLLDYLFQDLWVHRVRAFCLTENRASARLLERVGMRQEGYFQQSYWHRERWVDEYAYAILRDDWQKRRANLAGN